MSKFQGIFLSLILFLFATASLAENIPWDVMDQGGRTRTTTIYKLLDASGQGAIGRMTSPNYYNLSAGYILPMTITVVADFSVTPTAGCAPLTVNFSDSSTGNVLLWSWDFGDGDTGTIQNPTHTYTNPGTYTVSLIVSDTYGSYTRSRADYLMVECCSTVAADSSGTPAAGCAPLTVNFSDSSTGDILTWLWDFGDGDTSTVQNPTHTYFNPGIHTVSLTISDTCGSDTETKVAYIEVISPAILRGCMESRLTSIRPY